MQIYADVLGWEIGITATKQPGALGAAVIAATAASAADTTICRRRRQE